MDDETWTFEPHDLDRLTREIAAYSDPALAGFNAFVDPEPTVSKGRFGRKKEQSTGYSIGFMHSPEPAGLMMQIGTPNGAGAELLRAGNPSVPPGWIEHPDAGGDVIVYPGAPDPKATAEWIVTALRAFGAPFPTGKLRGYAPGTLGWRSGHH